MRLWYSLALAVLATLWSGSATLGSGHQQQPVFRSGVDLVTVDVHVVDGSGQPIRDLRPDDFAVTVEGAARRVVAIDFVAYAPATAGVPAPGVAPAAPTPAPGAVTRTLPARTILIVVDESNIRAGSARAAASAAVGFLDRLQPGDRVGLLTIPFSTIRIDPTTDRAVVRQALDRVVGHYTPVETLVAQRHSLGMAEAFALLNNKGEWAQIIARECVEGAVSRDNPGQPARECVSEMEHLARSLVADVRQRMLTSARALAGLMDGVAQVPGPKTIVLLSQELPVGAGLSERKDFEAETASIARAAAQAQASVYVLQIDRPLVDVDSRAKPGSLGADADMASSGLETVTTLTGGKRLMISGRAEPAFDRVAREVSGFYVVGFAPDARDRDGQPHAVTVKVKRDGAEVRARRLFAFTAGPQNALAAMTASVRPPVDTPPAPAAAAALAPVAFPDRPPAQPAPAAPSAPSQGQAAPPVQPPAAPDAPPAPAAVAPQGSAANVEELVQRASQWVTSYAEELSLVIGVEHYAQYMGEEAFSRAYGRQLVSEFALVRVKGDWLGFRDVYEVDGKPVGDRQDRLKKLFLEAPDAAVTQGRKISDESARYNLGAIQRNFNVPTMALFFLQSTNVARFKFRKDGEEVIDGHRVWKVRYQETRTPTIIRTSSGKDMPLTGTYWIDATAGQVLRTHMEISIEATMSAADPKARTGPTPPAARPETGQGIVTPKYGSTPWDTDTGVVRRLNSSASVTVTYRNDSRLGLLVPEKMMETYEGPTVNTFTGQEEVNKINCSATYSDFRRFETSGRIVAPK